MMHLSLLRLPRTSLAWRFMRPYELHQVLWRGFPGLDHGESENRFLYRHEERDDVHSVLVQSVTQPDWTFLADEAEGTTADVRTFDSSGINGEVVLEFFLRANPVVTRVYEDGSRRRIAVGSDRERLARKRGVTKEELPSRDEMLVEWLERQGEGGGFTVERGAGGRVLCDVGPNRDIVVRKSKEKGNPVTLTTIDFSGILRVTDAGSFARTLRHGLGRGRGFGCGLVSVRRT